ncbi:HicB_like antitoxin of toxin-antitoxin system [Ligilactobacillus sp. WC1T17]|uniref:HicB_like antitoxin of toxin-antitoxin system n=1 Tax=Ligilactobacillus ruminis TaxID=1623 RepID=A0ABY1AEY2_9LACO|nr:HicB_like antitoxin of toxin-antitoxin system [Ligilactobacillus ruminis]
MTDVIAYPAILDNNENDNGVYTVTFPDVPGAISEGKDVAHALKNGSEALGLMLYDAKEYPKVSDLSKVEKENPDAIVTLIFADLAEIKRTVKKPMVKKNTTIPGDLAQKAEEAGINFSQTLADALREKLA